MNRPSWLWLNFQTFPIATSPSSTLESVTRTPSLSYSNKSLVEVDVETVHNKCPTSVRTFVMAKECSWKQNTAAFLDCCGEANKIEATSTKVAWSRTKLPPRVTLINLDEGPSCTSASTGWIILKSCALKNKRQFVHLVATSTFSRIAHRLPP